MELEKRNRARWWAIAALVAALICGVIQPAKAAEAGVSYYVDAVAGSDSADGRSAQTAWRTLSKMNSVVLQPGDDVLLRRGSVWAGEQLALKGAGAAGAPVTVDAYGNDGAKPRIKTDGAHPDGLLLWNTDYWEVRNLDVSNATFAPDPVAYNAAGKAGDFRGIHIGGDDGREHHHFVLDAVDVHDVTGEVRWIGQRTGYTPPSGITFGNGWDRSKNTGGILVSGSVADVSNPGATATTFHGIVIENSTVQNTSFGAITIKQYTGDAPGAVATGWGDRADEADPRFSPHTDIIIRNNYITQAATAYGANGIYVTGAKNALVERNLVDRVGTSGIESYNTHNVVIQHNEVNYTTVKAGGQDSNAIDTDIASTDQVVQYNYVYGNGEGFLIYQQRFGDSIYRYNVVAESKRSQIHIASESIATGSIYNNTIIDSVGYMINGSSGRYTLQNNIFHSTSGYAVSTGGSNISYAGNLYSGVAPRPQESAPFTATPGFSAAPLTPPASGTPRAADLTQALRLIPTAGARSVNAAATIADNGGEDFRGVPLYQGAPDFGAFEYKTPDEQLTETVVGVVKSAASGSPVPGAVVTAAGTTGSATTDLDGWYALAGVPFGPAIEISVERNGFANARLSAAVASGTSTRADVALVATATKGTISGQAVDANAQPIAGARAAVQDAQGVEKATSVTGVDGTFTLEIPAGTEYTALVTADGYLTAVRTGISVEAGLDKPLGSMMLSGRDVSYEAIVDFEAFPVGSASNVAPLTAAQQNGTVTINEDGTNQFARLNRAGGAGSAAPATSLNYVSPAPLTGIITVEQKVRRPSGQPSTQFFGAPYIRNAAGQNLISVGFSNGNISAYNGGTYQAQVATYRADQWVHVKVIADTNTQTYSLIIDDRTVLQNARLRNPVGAGITTISNYADGPNAGILDVDDLRIAHGIGYTPSETSLASLVIAPGELTQTGPTRYLLTLAPGTQTAVVKAAALSPFAQKVTANGSPMPAGGEGVSVQTGAPITVEVTAEDGSVVGYAVDVRLPTPLTDDTAEVLAGQSVTIDVLGNDGATPALDPGTLALLNTEGTAVPELRTDQGTYIVESGKVVFRASTDGSGQLEGVRYQVTNATGATSTANLVVTVKPAPITEPAWSGATAYVTGDRVSYQGRVFVAQWWTKNQAPGATATGPWAEVGAPVACSNGGHVAWTASWIYKGGEIVAHDGQLWQAKWWTRNQVPGQPSGPWKAVGSC
ncbi:hypothetical protein FQP90_21275 [Paenarthrobacter nitroguajacolicus]|uniref:Chitin-binding type-3 domain-containing protein n=1 Tax=Paenarthrobacter nitroguajacolicus TaxID=211146 RepID=A0A558GNM3_PAENT|nr:carboxypeptidase regulatory-like domain-containing protein [Paenarthrobacter nitroguajacolicus]TVU58479.1 hypothetical protein FQP90_21275 [Paenarthrobacter nitroguajacolicus]